MVSFSSSIGQSGLDACYHGRLDEIRELSDDALKADHLLGKHVKVNALALAILGDQVEAVRLIQSRGGTISPLKAYTMLCLIPDAKNQAKLCHLLAVPTLFQKILLGVAKKQDLQQREAFPLNPFNAALLANTVSQLPALKEVYRAPHSVQLFGRELEGNDLALELVKLSQTLENHQFSVKTLRDQPRDEQKLTRLLIKASAMGRLSEIEYLHERELISLSVSCPFGCTPAYWAASTGQTAVLEYLYRQKVDLSAGNPSGEAEGLTPAYLGALNGDVSVLELLHRVGCDWMAYRVSTSGLKGYTLAEVARARGHLNVLEFFDRIGVDVIALLPEGMGRLEHNDAEKRAAIGAFIEKTKKKRQLALLLLEKRGIDPSKPVQRKTLCRLAFDGQSEMLKVLKFQGVDITSGATPSWVPFSSELMDEGDGASSSMQSSVPQGLFCNLAVATAVGRDPQILDLLHTWGINLSSKTSIGGQVNVSPESIAANYGDVEMLIRLYTLGVCPQDNGLAAAFEAIEGDHPQILEALSQRGVDLRASHPNPVFRGLTPEGYAKMQDAKKCLEKLRALGVTIA